MINFSQCIMKLQGLFGGEKLPIQTNFITINNIMHYSDFLSFTLRKIKINDEIIKNRIFPILIEHSYPNNWAMIYTKRGHTILYPNKTNDIAQLDILQAWVCMPNCFSAKNFRQLLRQLSYFKKNIIFLFVLSLIAALQPLILTLIAALVINSNFKIPSVNFLCLSLLLSGATLCHYVKNLYLDRFTMSITSAFLTALWNKILSTPLKYLSSLPLDQLSIFLESAEELLAVGNRSLFNLMVLFVAIILCVCYIASLSISFVLTALLINAIFMLSKFYLITSQFSMAEKILIKEGALLNQVQEIFFKLTKIKLENLEVPVLTKWLTSYQRLKKLHIKKYKKNLKLELLDGLLPIAIFSIFYFYLHNLDQQGTSLLMLFSVIQMTQLLLKATQEVINLVSFIPQLKVLVQLNKTPTTDNLKRWYVPIAVPHIEMNNISFKINGHSILKQVSLSLRPGSFIGIQGASGCGKSTLMKIILGLLPYDDGDIRIDGQNLNNIHIASLNSVLTGVLQSTRLLPGTIFSNIVSNSSMTLEEAWEVAENVGLADDLIKMPMRMFTYVSDNPSDSLSGGQQQKLLIARALARKPKILLLDEATSALDNISELKVVSYLNHLKITRLMVAHRLSTLREANAVFCLRNGHLRSVC